MKLASIELCGFRGFKHRTLFDIPLGFVVLTGRNGVGKSTILDAIEFALSGTISKFAVTGAKGGGLEEHIWWVGEGSADSHFVTVRFVDDDGQLLEVTRSRDNGIQGRVEDLAKSLCTTATPVMDGWAETLIRTTLIRDETLAALSLDLPEQARFTAVRSAIGALGGPDYSQRTSALLKTAESALTRQKGRLAEVQADLGRALSALTEARSIAEKQPDLAEANKLLQTIAPSIQGTPAQRAAAIRQKLAAEKQALDTLRKALERAKDLEKENKYWNSAEARSEIESASAELQTAREMQSSAAAVLKTALELRAAAQRSDEFISHLVALLEHGAAVGLQEGHCPLCSAARSEEEFHAGVEAARANLSVRGLEIAKIQSAVDQATEQYHRAQGACVNAEQRVTGLNERQSGYLHAVSELVDTFNRFNLAVAPLDLQSATKLLSQREEELLQIEQAIYLLDASAAQDKVVSLEAQVERLRHRVEEEAGGVATAERVQQAARQIELSAKAVANELSQEQFDTVLPLLKELYRRLRPHVTWREIDTDFGGRVRASLNLTVGDGRNPQFLFSSGQRRAAGIAFLLAIHLSRSWCRLNTILLDDPIQHVDDYRALNLVEVLSAIRKSGRQVVIAVEDPALADVLCRRLRSTPIEFGRRFDLAMSTDGSAAIEATRPILPLPRETLRAAS